MSEAGQNRFFWKMLDRLLVQRNVPKEERVHERKVIFKLLKEIHGVKSFSSLKGYDKWKFCNDCEMLLISEYGYFVDDDHELKF